MNKTEPWDPQTATASLHEDPQLFGLLSKELERQRHTLELIASENIVSPAVLRAAGSVLTNKYAEGYPGRRYYGGCHVVDEVEDLANQRLKKLFNAQYVNVQPHSGASANLAAFLAFLKPGDTFLGMSLAEGGHLTHGSPVTISGKWFCPVSYGVNPDTGLIDYDEVQEKARAHRPRLIIAGGSAYSRIIDFKRFREIADSVGAYLMVDMAHFAGLVAAGLYPSPLPYAHVVTSTTHKTLCGPRGGVLLTNEPEWGKKLSSAVFPGSQGGPLMHIIAAKAVAFGEALQPSFKIYAKQVIDNAKALGQTLVEEGLQIVSGGTDTHLLLVDLRAKNITGKAAEEALDEHRIACNKNSIPQDPLPPKLASGIRVGTPALTSRGFKEDDCRLVGHLISKVLNAHGRPADEVLAVKDQVLKVVEDLCLAHPIYPSLRTL